jgi:putative hemolysin
LKGLLELTFFFSFALSSFPATQFSMDAAPESLPRTASAIPSSGGAGTSYAVRFARTDEEIRAALRLRFEVFNLELNEGLAASHATGMDEDEFDEVCDHLIVTKERTGEVVGTYRMQTGSMAGLNLGYYSACEFDLTPFEPVRGSLVELGRACVHRDHRSIAVISMLWKEIVRCLGA